MKIDGAMKIFLTKHGYNYTHIFKYEQTNICFRFSI